MKQFVDIAVPLGLRRTFVYSVPPALQARVSVGRRVLVPFGRKLLSGIAVRYPAEPPDGAFRIRAVRDVLEQEEAVPPQLVETALWIADYYFTAPGEILRALLPTGSRVAGDRKVRLTKKAERLLSGGLRPLGISPREDLILDHLFRSGEQTLKRLAAELDLRDSAPLIESLSADGWVEAEDYLERSLENKVRLGIRIQAAFLDAPPTLTPLQQKLLAQLDRDGGFRLLQEALKQCGCNISVARSLEKKGVVEIAPIKVDRIPVDLTENTVRKMVVFTPLQQSAFDALCAMLDGGRPARCLLHGVTGSGKTEIYLRLMAEVLRRGETAMLLVPEIGLTPMLGRIASSHFPDKVALLHSGMSAGERFDQWHRIRAGAAPVVLGTRSAVFAPLDRLRLAIIDEEQDGSYKQDESPCYHAREVAWQRIRRSGGLLLMGSATPSVETYHAAKNEGSSAYLSLPERIEARPLAEVTIVDMSVEFQRFGKKTVVSQTLRRGLEERLGRGEQSIVLLNRRGYSRFLICRSCGHVFTCPDCSISMTYHQESDRLVCHYCGHEAATPSACAGCGKEYIYFVGVGTEQLEKILRTMLPGARLARLDRDSTRRRGALRRTLLDFAAGNLDILVGTQILAKGHDFPNVTLVGVVGADAGLSFPDFRSAERTFQLLTQVAGRAGRGAVPGQVVIQSFYPDHYALRFARKQDYQGFFEHEIQFRRLLGYPPFSGLVQILVSAPEADRAKLTGEKVAGAVRIAAARQGKAARLRVLGPAAAPLEKLRGRYRYQVLLKAAEGEPVSAILQEAFEELTRRKVNRKNIRVDVDPLSLL